MAGVERHQHCGHIGVAGCMPTSARMCDDPANFASIAGRCRQLPRLAGPGHGWDAICRGSVALPASLDGSAGRGE